MITPLSDTFIGNKLHLDNGTCTVPSDRALSETRAKVNEIIAYLNNKELELKPIPQEKVINFYKNRIKKLEKELKALKENKK